MKFFDYFVETPTGFIDVFKSIDISDILDSTDYKVYTPTDLDNLMSISYKFYDTTDDWWVICLFNQIQDVLFAIVPTKIIRDQVDGIIEDVKNFPTITDEQRKLEIQEIIRYHFIISGYSIFDAAQKTNDVLATEENRYDAVFLLELSQSIFNHLVMENIETNPIKVPGPSVVTRIKQRMNNYHSIWLEATKS